MTERGNDLALCRADARVHRCDGCGAWCYGEKPCATCEGTRVARREVAC